MFAADAGDMDASGVASVGDWDLARDGDDDDEPVEVRLVISRTIHYMDVRSAITRAVYERLRRTNFSDVLKPSNSCYSNLFFITNEKLRRSLENVFFDSFLFFCFLLSSY